MAKKSKIKKGIAISVRGIGFWPKYQHISKGEDDIYHAPTHQY